MIFWSNGMYQSAISPEKVSTPGQKFLLIPNSFCLVPPLENGCVTHYTFCLAWLGNHRHGTNFKAGPIWYFRRSMCQGEGASNYQKYEWQIFHHVFLCVTDGDILRMVGILNTNGVSQGPMRGHGLYPTFSYISHR